LAEEAVQVRVRRALDVKVAPANVVERLVVDLNVVLRVLRGTAPSPLSLGELHALGVGVVVETTPSPRVFLARLLTSRRVTLPSQHESCAAHPCLPAKTEIDPPITLGTMPW
jgi:hypothetical protein